jgi:hypothetical protein
LSHGDAVNQDSFATINRQRLIKCETNELALNAIVLDPV